MLFTTSWDDGYQSDLQMAALLEKYGCKGTFYVSPAKQKDLMPLLTATEIRSLGERHEIGAHSINHPHLTTIALEQARAEIVESKRWVEERTGKPCRMFCYPYGDENDAGRTLVKEAGFEGARCVQMLQFSAGQDAFALPTTLPAFPVLRRRWKRWWHPLDPFGWVRVQRKRLHELGTPLLSRRSWPVLARWLFDEAIRTNQPVFHLWGHTNGVERNQLWSALEEFLQYVTSHKNMQYDPNSALLPLVGK